jgi:hypothetical protein
MREFKHTFFHPLILLLSAASLLTAEEITTSDGQVYSTSSMTRSGNSILVKVATESGGTLEEGIPIKRIVKVSFAEPPELAQVRTASEDCNTAEVISLSRDYVSKEMDFRDLPGSWWSQIADARLLALASAGKNAEASSLADHIGSLQTPGSASLARGGTLFGSLESGDTAAVILGAKALPAVGGDKGSALAQLALGRALLLKKDYPGALRAFLTIKVFYPSVTLLQPAALLGAASAYIGLKDTTSAKESLQDIFDGYPNSIQVSEAKNLREQLSKS